MTTVAAGTQARRLARFRMRSPAAAFPDDFIRPQPRQVWVTDLVVALAVMLTVGFPFSLHSDFSYYVDWGIAATWLPLTAAFAVRRVSPRLAYLLMTVGYLIKLLTGAATHGSDVAILMVFYTTAALGNRALLRLGAVTAVTYPLIFAVHQALFPRPGLLVIGDLAGQGLRGPGEFLLSMLYLGVPMVMGAVVFWLAGLVQRIQVSRREAAYAAELAEIEYERSREQLVVEQERHQIARDMHDIVAHSLAVVVAQANGGRYLARVDSEKSQEVLATIADTAREALVDVRGLLAQLRHTQEQHSQHTMADLDQLYARIRAAGLNLEVREEGEPRALGQVAQVAIYRLVQEALTNSLKYGDTSKPTCVEVGWRDALEVTVRNGLAPGRQLVTGARHGLIGMRERILVIGGRVHAGAEYGDFVVRARIPFQGDALEDEPRVRASSGDSESDDHLR